MDEKFIRELIDAIVSGDISVGKIEEHVPPAAASFIRRKAIEELTGTELISIGSSSIENETIFRRAENIIGAISVPVGVVGPLRIKGEHANGSFYVPMA